MANYVCDGAGLSCTFGLAPGSLSVLPSKRIQMGGKEAANIMDFAPMTNISDFGNCTSLINPVVAAATAKNMGVLEPQKCVPVVVAPWMPGNPTVFETSPPALTDQCINTCMWMGIIQITNPGQMTVTCEPGPDMSAMIADLQAQADAASKEMEDKMDDLVEEAKKEKAEEEAKKKK